MLQQRFGITLSAGINWAVIKLTNDKFTQTVQSRRKMADVPRIWNGFG